MIKRHLKCFIDRSIWNISPVQIQSCLLSIYRIAALQSFFWKMLSFDVTKLLILKCSAALRKLNRWIYYSFLCWYKSVVLLLRSTFCQLLISILGKWLHVVLMFVEHFSAAVKHTQSCVKTEAGFWAKTPQSYCWVKKQSTNPNLQLTESNTVKVRGWRRHCVRSIKKDGHVRWVKSYCRHLGLNTRLM